MGLGWWRSTGVGPQVQVPMFYDAHYLYPRAWTQEQSAPGVPAPALIAFYGPNRISQSFVSGADQLSMVELWLAGQENRVVTVSLADDQGRIIRGDIPLTQGEEGGIYRLSFAPFPNSQDRRFTLTLWAPEASRNEPMVTRTVGGDRLDGSLNLNEYNRPGNLELMTYARGWPGMWWLNAVGQQILPSPFRLRLQQYKPPLFKGMFFSLLLVVTAGLSILYLILARPQAKPSLQTLSRTLGWVLALILVLFLIWQMTDGRMKLAVLSKNNKLETAGSPIAKAPPPGTPSRIIIDLVSNLWTARRDPEARSIDYDLVDGLPAIRVPADSRLGYLFDVPPHAHFRTGIAGEGRGELRVKVSVGEDIIRKETVTAMVDPGEKDVTSIEIDLTPWSGQAIMLNLITESVAEEVDGLWLMPQIETESDWLFPDPLPQMANIKTTDFRFGESADLIGYEVERSIVQAGEALTISLYWRPLKLVDKNAKIFVHILDDEGHLVAQHDAHPVNNSYPLPAWQNGTIILDEHVLQLPADLRAGRYDLAIGIYDPDTLQRWPVSSPDEMSITERRVLLRAGVEVVR